MAQAKAQAEEALKRVQDGEDLEKLSDEYEGSVYYESEEAYYSSGYAYGDWLFSQERKAGDSAVLEDEKGYYVMIFRDRFRHEYPTVAIRDISFPVSPAAENLTRNTKIPVRQRKPFWRNGNLETGRKSSSRSSMRNIPRQAKKNNGLYENVLKDQLASQVDSWSFDETRKPGDCEVIYADEGFHVLYFVGFQEPAWEIEAEKIFGRKRFRTCLTASWTKWK